MLGLPDRGGAGQGRRGGVSALGPRTELDYPLIRFQMFPAGVSRGAAMLPFRTDESLRSKLTLNQQRTTFSLAALCVLTKSHQIGFLSVICLSSGGKTPL